MVSNLDLGTKFVYFIIILKQHRNRVSAINRTLVSSFVILMRRSNCSPPPPGKPRGQRKNVCDKKVGALENEVKKGRGTGKERD